MWGVQVGNWEHADYTLLNSVDNHNLYDHCYTRKQHMYMHIIRVLYQLCFQESTPIWFRPSYNIHVQPPGHHLVIIPIIET